MYLASILMIAAAGYALGNFNGAIITSKLLLKEDVRQHGSGNAGLTNFFRSYGGASTLLVLAIDVLKTVVAALLGGWLLGKFGQPELGRMLGGVFTVLGHMFPLLFQFHGGKGILCCGALAGVMDWRILAALLLLFVLVLLFTKYVSLASILGAAAYIPAFALRFWGNWPVIALACVMALSAIYMHRANIMRLVHGTENKFSFSRKK